jgi:hypothetical protein
VELYLCAPPPIRVHGVVINKDQEPRYLSQLTRPWRVGDYISGATFSVAVNPSPFSFTLSHLLNLTLTCSDIGHCSLSLFYYYSLCTDLLFCLFGFRHAVYLFFHRLYISLPDSSFSTWTKLCFE